MVTFNDENTGFEEPKYPEKGTLIRTICKGYDQYGEYANGNGGTYDELIAVNSSTCGYVEPGGGGGTGSGGGTGGGGGNTGGDPNDGRERIDGGAGKAENFR